MKKMHKLTRANQLGSWKIAACGMKNNKYAWLWRDVTCPKCLKSRKT